MLRDNEKQKSKGRQSGGDVDGELLLDIVLPGY